MHLWKSCCLHEWCKTCPVTSIWVGTKCQQKTHKFKIKRRDKIDLRAKEVALVWVCPMLQQQACHICMTVPNSQPQGLITDGGAREWVISIFTIIHLCSLMKQQFHQFCVPEVKLFTIITESKEYFVHNFALHLSAVYHLKQI